MSWNIGFFPQFKDTDSVLLTGTPDDVRSLSAQLEQFAASGQESLAIHSLAHVSRTSPASLFASRSPPIGDSAFHLACSPRELPAIQGKLSSLANSGHGHQYFNLAGSSAELVVSVGEYNASWWQAHA